MLRLMDMHVKHCQGRNISRLLLSQPHALFCSHFSHLHHRNPETSNRPAPTPLLLEILMYRFQGKSKTFVYDVTEVLARLKRKHKYHRVYRLAENLCMNLIVLLREFFFCEER